MNLQMVRSPRRSVRRLRKVPFFAVRRTPLAAALPSSSPDPTLHYGDMPQVAVLGADFAALKVPARDLGGLTALQELVRESPPAQLIDGVKLVLPENEIFRPRMRRRAAGGS